MKRPSPLKDLGKQIKLLRKANGMTQKELGQAVGMVPSHVSQLEVGRLSISLPYLCRVCSALNATLAIVFDLNSIEIKNGTTEQELFSGEPKIPRLRGKRDNGKNNGKQADTGAATASVL